MTEGSAVDESGIEGWLARLGWEAGAAAAAVGAPVRQASPAAEFVSN